MISYSLYITAKASSDKKDIYNRDYFNFDRVNFEDCFCIIKNLFLYPGIITRIRLVQYAFNDNIDSYVVKLNSFKVTFYGNNFISEPIFTLEKD